MTERAQDSATQAGRSLAALVPQTRPVAFQECSQRSGPISWAQVSVWAWIGRGLTDGNGTNYDHCFSAEIPPGTTVDDFLKAVVRMVCRHESLRTRFPYADGRLARQEVIGTGYVDVTQYQVRPGHVLTDELLRSWVNRDALDIENGYPFRAGFVSAAGLVTHVAFAVSLVIADAGACENIISSFLSELAEVKSGASAAHGPVFQQLDQVEWEISARGLAAERQALDYWHNQMQVIQALPRPAVLDGGAMRSVIVPADAFLASADDIAQVCASSSSAIILAAFLQATAQTLHLDGLGCYLHCSNRTDARRRSSISRLKNATVISYFPRFNDFRSTIREVFRKSLEAYRYAQSPGGLFLPRLNMSAGDAPFAQFNDVRTVVVTDRVQAATPQQAGAGLEKDAGRLMMTEIPPLDSYSPTAILNLGLGPLVGHGPLDGWRNPILRIETNVLNIDDIPRLLNLMKTILTTASLPAE